MFHHRSSLGPVELAFTDRHGGVSAVPFDSLNLAFFQDGGRTVPRQNLAILIDHFAPGCSVSDTSQVHGRDVVLAADRAPDERRPQADGIVTDRPDVVLLMRAADCVPVLLADPDVGVVGAAHAGRQGVAAGVVPATPRAMRDLGARNVTAWIGPHVCGRCYEVPERLRDEVEALAPGSAATTSWGTPSVDLGAGVRTQLEALDVSIVDVSTCTRESPDLFSHRRDGASAGRHAGLIRLVDP